MLRSPISASKATHRHRVAQSTLPGEPHSKHGELEAQAAAASLPPENNVVERNAQVRAGLQDLRQLDPDADLGIVRFPLAF